MFYNILEQNPEDVRGLPLLPPVWWRAGMGPHLPEKTLDSLSAHAIDVDAEEEGHAIYVDAGDAEHPTEQGPKAKRHKTMLRQECKDWLLDFIQYQKKLY
eukprot:3413988-Amphidinium_carterae.1